MQGVLGHCATSLPLGRVTSRTVPIPDHRQICHVGHEAHFASEGNVFRPFVRLQVPQQQFLDGGRSATTGTSHAHCPKLGFRKCVGYLIRGGPRKLESKNSSVRFKISRNFTLVG